MGVNSLFPIIGTQAGRGREAGDKLFSLTGRAPNPVDWKKTCAHTRGKVCEFHLSVTSYLIAPLNI